MPVLAINQPLEQREPVLLVENRLAVGVHRFALVVVDDRGIESAPDVISVSVRRAIVVTPGPVLVDTRIDVPGPPPAGPVIHPAVVNPAVVNPVIVNPAIVNPRPDTAVVRPRRTPRRSPRKGTPDGPE